MTTETQPQLLGRYALERLIGEGVTARVYAAKDDDGRAAAVKVMRPEVLEHPEARARFHREARALMSIEHENVVTLYDYSGVEVAAPFIAMERLRGRTLAALVDERGALPEAVAAAVMMQVAAGLAAAHAERLLHRDLSLGNLFVEDSGRVVVSDFGLAAAVRGARTSETFVTRAEKIVGTPLFFSPEILRAQKYSVASDLYALGVALSFVLLGKAPVPTQDISQLLAAILDGELEPLRAALPRTNPRLLALSEALLGEADGRPADAAAVIRALAPLAASRAEVAEWLGLEAQTRVKKIYDHERTIVEAVGQGDTARAIAVASGGRYVLGALLGEGGMGRVFVARDKQLKQDVAIKILHDSSPEQRLRFHREARALGRLRHPNIVSLIDYSGRDAPLPYLVLEHIDGATFEAVITLRALTEDVALIVGERVARALAAAHAEGIVHRDVKPENVFIDSRGRVLLTDFGIARGLATEGTFAVRDTRAIGTPLYASPEQLNSPDRVSAASDLFSLGSLIHACLIGADPIPGKTLPEVMSNISRGIFSPLPDSTSEQLVDLLGRLHMPEPSARPASAVVVANELAGLIARRGITDPDADVAQFFGLDTFDRRGAGGTKTNIRSGVAQTKPARQARGRLIAALASISVLALGGLSLRFFRSDEITTIDATPVPTTPPADPALAPPEPIPMPATPQLPPAPVPATATPERNNHSARPHITDHPEKPAPAPIAVRVVPATLRFITKPWANISIDGRAIGATPVVTSTELAPGSHLIRFEHPGFASVEQRIELKNGEEREVRVTLNK